MSRTLESLLGQDKLVSEIIFRMDQTRDFWHVLSGPSGCGKSWVLGHLVEEWRRLKYPVVELQGDRLQQARPYYPYLSSLARRPSHLIIRRQEKKGLSEAGRLIPIAGSLASLVLDTVLSHKERSQIAHGLFLSETEHEILFHLQEIAGDEPLLLAADDLQYWDHSSITLLEYLSSQELKSIYPFLTQLRVVACLTQAAPSTVPVFTREIPLKEWPLTYLPFENLSAVLSALGVSAPLASADQALIYSVSGGHLEILKRLAEYLSAADIHDLGAAGNPNNPSFKDLLSTLLEERFKRFELDGLSLLRLLELAAVVGTRFSEEEIRCLTQATDSSLLAIIPQAEKLQLLRRDGGGYAFAHEVLQRYFQQRADSHTSSLHQAFATCISRLRPADYLTRALHLQAAGLDIAANEIQFLAFLQAVRDGDTPLAQLEDLCTKAGSADRVTCYRSLTEAYRLYLDGDLAQAQRRLERIEDTLPPLLAAEKDYMLALCLKRSKNDEDVRFAKALLQSWVGLKSTEAEQWFRIMSMLMVMHADGGNFSEAKLCERELMSYFGERLSYDPYAASGLNRLRRRCAALHSAEIAAERCRTAATYFGPVGTSRLPLNPLQWYLSLTNLSGNLLMIGEFQEANDVARRALDVSRDFGAAMRRPELPINNLVVSALLTESIASEEAEKMLGQALTVSRRAGDSAIIVNNMAAAKARSGRLKEALEDLEGVAERACEEFYDFYSYFIASNSVAIRFVLGGDASLVDAWDKILVPEIPDGDRIFLSRRHELQRNAFNTWPLTYKEWDSYLSTKHRDELGPTWQFYGRGFIFSDLQFWFDF